MEYRHTGNREIAAEVRLRENADRVARRDLPRRRADAAFPTERNRPGAGAHGALGDGPALRIANRIQDVLGLDVQAANVVQPAIVGLPDDSVYRLHTLVARLSEGVAHDSIDGDTDGERIGEHDWGFDRAELGNLRRTGELAKRVADEDGAGDLLVEHVPVVRHDGRHSGPHGVAFDDRGVADPYAGDVRDGVERAGRQHARDDAEIARARPLLRRHAETDGRDASDRETQSHSQVSS